MTVGPWSHVAVGAAGAHRQQRDVGMVRGARRRRARAIAPSRSESSYRRRRVAGPSGLASGHQRPDVVPRTARRPPRRSTALGRARIVLPFDPSHPTPTVGGPSSARRARSTTPAWRPARLPHHGVRPLQTRRSRGRAGRHAVPLQRQPHADLFVRLSDWALTAAPTTSPKASRGWIRTGGRVRFPCASGPRPTGSSPGTASAW